MLLGINLWYNFIVKEFLYNIPTENKNETIEKMEELITNIMSEAEKFEIKENNIDKEGRLLVCPDGPISNLGKQSELWWKIARTESFKKFFGDWEKDPESSSKIIDQNGEPLVLFRGVHKDISLSDFYDKEKYCKRNIEDALGKGVYVTPIPLIAQQYGGGHVYPIFVSAKNLKYVGSFTGNIINKTQQMFKILIPGKILKFISKISPIKYDSVIGKSANPNKRFTKEVGDVFEIAIKNPSQVLLIPSTLKKIRKPVASYAGNLEDPFFDGYLWNYKLD